MKKNTLKFSALALLSILLVGCNGTDSNPAATENSGESAVTNEISTEATVENTEGSTENTDSDSTGVFTSIALETGIEQNVDLGNDGNKDTLMLSMGSSDFSDGYSIVVNGDSFDILSQKDANSCESVDVTYVQNDSGDYLLVNREGFSNLADVTLYKWDNQAFKEIDSIESMNYTKDADAITADHVVLFDNWSPFTGWNFCKNYSFDERGFATTDMMYTIRPGFCCPGSLTLKSSLTLNDENGNPTTTLDAGQKIIPFEGTNEYQAGSSNTISFTSEDGQFLGFTTYEYVVDEDGYNVLYVDGVKDDDLFADLIKAG